VYSHRLRWKLRLGKNPLSRCRTQPDQEAENPMRIALGLATALTLGASAVPMHAQCPLDAQTTDPDDRTCFVSTTGSDANEGTRAAPLRNIQFAIDLASGSTAFQTIRVLPGTYTECPNAYFVIPAEPPAPPVPRATNLEIVADDFLANGTRATTILDGTTICGTTAADPPAVVTIGDQGRLRGFTIKGGGNSGVYGLGHVQITNNIISGNAAASGGGIRLYTGEYVNDETFKATISFNRIENNKAKCDGAGISVRAYAFGGKGSDVTLDQNEILSNTVESPCGASPEEPLLGGGISIRAYTDAALDTSTVVVTSNTIDGNAVLQDAERPAYGGGLAVLTSGNGEETIDVGTTAVGKGNAIRNNEVGGGYGGGLAALAQGKAGATHHLRVQSNSVTANTADLGGGGMYLRNLALDLTSGTTAQLLARGNNVSGNSATDPTPSDPPGPAWGGGIYADFHNERTVSTGVTLEILGNTLRQNRSDAFGGGAALYSRAYNESASDPALGAAESTITFRNNLVVFNHAVGETDVERDGGGVYAVGVGSGATGVANLDLQFNTFADNDVDPGGGGGLALVGLTYPDVNGANGFVHLEVGNSIFLRNDAFGIGGPAVPGLANVSASIRYNDFFGNPEGAVSANLDGSASDTLTVDPKLDVNYIAPLCSATIDAGNPSSGTFDADDGLLEEQQPNGRAANLGHTGLTSNATITLPDVDGSGRVDGLDLIDLAYAFSTVSSDPRYDIDADRNRDNAVDGDDLSYVAAHFGRSCP
jgi:hypothetical protein